MINTTKWLAIKISIILPVQLPLQNVYLKVWLRSSSRYVTFTLGNVIFGKYPVTVR